MSAGAGVSVMTASQRSVPTSASIICQRSMWAMRLSVALPGGGFNERAKTLLGSRSRNFLKSLLRLLGVVAADAPATLE